MTEVKVMLAPNRDMAESYIQENGAFAATVEAEYGDYCIEGTEATLAHHGSRSMNPAPCNTPDVPTLTEGTILVSHLDLDSLGGVLDLMGEKIEDPDFWKGAEFIDLNGPHHIQELSQDVQDKLNAVYAWDATQPRVRYMEMTDVTDVVDSKKEMLSKVLDERHPEHEKMLQDGRDWKEKTTRAVENCLESETRYSRHFITDSTFCASGYYSAEQDNVVPATVTLNTKLNSITVSFADSGEKVSAKEFVQGLWGPEAGERDGIAGSPRGWDLSPEEIKEEFHRACSEVDNVLQQEFDKILPLSGDQTPEQIMEAIKKDPTSIVNVAYDEDFKLAKEFAETGIVPDEWEQDLSL